MRPKVRNPGVTRRRLRRYKGSDADTWKPQSVALYRAIPIKAANVSRQKMLARTRGFWGTENGSAGVRRPRLDMGI